MKIHRNKGFTLLELLVVITVLSLLAGMLVPTVANMTEESKLSRLMRDLDAIKTAVNRYYFDVSVAPPRDHNWDDASERNVFVTGSGEPSTWKGPYVERWGKSPWNWQYHWEDWHYVGGTSDIGNYTIDTESIPSSVGQEIDKRLDDGNTGAGLIQMRGSRLLYGVGVFKIPQGGNG